MKSFGKLIFVFLVVCILSLCWIALAVLTILQDWVNTLCSKVESLLDAYLESMLTKYMESLRSDSTRL
jgi:hypothetical protein